MKTIKSAILLQQLMESSISLLEDISRLEEYTGTGQLEMNDGEGRWNTLQVLEHLNSYYAYYLPMIEKKSANSNSKPRIYFAPGWLGGYFTNMMQPKDGTIKNKMKAFSNHIPAPHLQASKVIEEFLQHQRKLIYLLEFAKNRDINSIRIPISLTPFIKLKLGDTFNFIVAHNNRHRIQINNLLAFNKMSFQHEKMLAR